MISQCKWENLIIALPVAFYSGIGVAVSLFDDQMASLLGVAISASLLPPAINSGIVANGCSFLCSTEEHSSNYNVCILFKVFDNLQYNSY
mmetsp:Transcript_28655/g.51879  ORF Transcript_28655/g.51879 Transcript_28655/m.51879 type:complete len:90 (-) Transcript_28655:175-444(-)